MPHCDCRSRFRILKGGKISLVVSALLVGSSLYAIPCTSEINTSITTTASGCFSALTVTSTGRIDITGNSPFGVSIESWYQDIAFVNEGTVSVINNAEGGTAIGALFDITYLGYDHNITNKGTISATYTGDINSGSIGIEVTSGDNSSNIVVTNSGTISISAFGEDNAMGIAFFNDMIGTSRIENSGIITVNANGMNYNNGFFLGTAGIFTPYMAGNATIVNSGEINVSNPGGIAAGIEVLELQDNSNITNTGTINVDASYVSIGIFTKYLESNTSIVNSGTISATVSGEFDKMGFSIFSMFENNGNIINEVDGKLYGNIRTGFFGEDSGLFTNKGLISLPYNATGEDSAFISNFLQTSTGVLEIGLKSDSNGDILGHSQLKTKNAHFENGSTINVNVLSLEENQNLLVGQTLQNVLTAETSLTIDGTLNVTDNSALLDFNYTTSAYNDTNVSWNGNGNAGAIHLNIVEGSSILDATIQGGGETPAQNIAGLLDQANDNASPEMADFISDLNDLPTNQQVANAVANAAPDTAGAVSGAATQIVNSVQGIVEQRQNVGFGGGLNSGDITFNEKSVWVKPFGAFGSQNDKDSMNGFDVKAYGLGMGIDGEYAADQKLGFALFFTKANVDINNVTQEADIDAYTALVYGSVPVLDAQTKFLYQFGYSWLKTDTTKIIMGNAAKADYTANSTFLDLKLMRNYQINQDWKLQPIVEMTYRHFKTPSYTESYTAMNYEEASASELLAGLGVRSSYKIDDKSQFVANANIAYDLKNDTQGVNVFFPSTSSTFVEGIDNGRWSYKVGIGYERYIDKNSNINISFDREGQGSDFVNNTISAKYVYKF